MWLETVTAEQNCRGRVLSLTCLAENGMSPDWYPIKKQHVVRLIQPLPFFLNVCLFGCHHTVVRIDRH
jgi:hypothetical protein